MTVHTAETLVGAHYAVVVVGEHLSEHYRRDDLVTLAETVPADVLSVGDGSDAFPPADIPPCYVGRVQDLPEVLERAGAILLVGVSVEAASDIQWESVDGEVVVVSARPGPVYTTALEDAPVGHWLLDADADTLQQVATDVSELAAPTTPGRVYSDQPDYPDPPAALLSTDERPAEVRQCDVCHTATNNKQKIGEGYPAAAFEWQCPAANHRNHSWLERLLDRRERLDRRRARQDETTATGRQTRQRIETKRAQLTAQIDALREWFDGRFDDVVGGDPAVVEGE